ELRVTAARAQVHVFHDRTNRHDAFFFPVFRAKNDARADRVARPARVEFFAFDRDAAGDRALRAVNQFQQLRAARADESEEPDDLAFRDGKTHGLAQAGTEQVANF